MKTVLIHPASLVSRQIHSQTLLMPRQAGELTLHRVEFRAAEFEAAAFDEAAIACPAAIARSVRKRQAEYFHGRVAARRALSALGVPLVEIGVAANGAPVWPAGIAGSITHNDRCAIATAVLGAGLHGIGIDVESIAEPAYQQSISAIAVDPGEEALLRTHPNLTLAFALTLAFSAKESFYKAVSTAAGRILEFDAIKLTRIAGDMRGGQVHFVAAEAISRQWPPGQTGEIAYTLLPSGEIVTAFSW